MRKLIQRFKNSPVGMFACDLKNLLTQAPADIAKLERKFVSCKPKGNPVGNVLLCYNNHGFVMKSDDPSWFSHTNRWESFQIAQTFLDVGYQVDVINENNDRFIPTKNYSFFVGNRINFERIARLVNPDCVKILHIDTSHWLFNNMAEGRRLELLKERRGCVLAQRRMMKPNNAIEHADYATILGTESTMNTYRYAGKRLFPIPISTPVLYPWQDDKDFSSVSRRFLWFGSEGCVHKGLDLVLEAFAQLPDCHLTICGPIRGERDFESEYYDELYNTPNIHLAGWVDVRSPEFIEVAKSCVGLIYPSCSEGQSGGVVTCIHAGLIPIISSESGVNVDGFGHVLESCSIDAIKDSIRAVSSLSVNELSDRARKAWEYARATHTRDQFAKVYAESISEIMAMEHKKEHVQNEPVVAGAR